MKKFMTLLLVLCLAPVVVGAENISPEFQYEQEYNKYRQEIEKNQQLVAQNQQMKEEYEQKLLEYQNQLDQYDKDSAEYAQKLVEYEQAKIEYQKKLDAYYESLKNLNEVINSAPGGIDTPIAKNLHLPTNGSPIIHVYDANDNLIAKKQYDDMNSTDYIDVRIDSTHTSVRVDYIYNQDDVQTDATYHNTTISKISQTVTLDPSSQHTDAIGDTKPHEDYNILIGPKFGFKFVPLFVCHDDIRYLCESAKQAANPYVLDSIFDVKIQLFDTNDQLVNIEDGFPLQFVNESFKYFTSTIDDSGTIVQRQTYGYIEATNTTFNPIKSSVIAQNNGIYYPTTTTNNNNNKAGFYLSSGTEYNYTYHEKVIDDDQSYGICLGHFPDYIGESSYIKDYLDYTPPVAKPELPIEPRKPVFPTKPEEPKYHIIVDPIPPVKPETVSTGSDNLVITLTTTIIIASTILLYRRNR